MNNLPFLFSFRSLVYPSWIGLPLRRIANVWNSKQNSSEDPKGSATCMSYILLQKILNQINGKMLMLQTKKKKKIDNKYKK